MKLSGISSPSGKAKQIVLELVAARLLPTTNSSTICFALPEGEDIPDSFMEKINWQFGSQKTAALPWRIDENVL